MYKALSDTALKMRERGVEVGIQKEVFVLHKYSETEREEDDPAEILIKCEAATQTESVSGQTLDLLQAVVEERPALEAPKKVLQAMLGFNRLWPKVLPAWHKVMRTRRWQRILINFFHKKRMLFGGTPIHTMWSFWKLRVARKKHRLDLIQRMRTSKLRRCFQAWLLGKDIEMKAEERAQAKGGVSLMRLVEARRQVEVEKKARLLAEKGVDRAEARMKVLEKQEEERAMMGIVKPRYPQKFWTVLGQGFVDDLPLSKPFSTTLLMSMTRGDALAACFAKLLKYWNVKSRNRKLVEVIYQRIKEQHLMQTFDRWVEFIQLKRWKRSLTAKGKLKIQHLRSHFILTKWKEGTENIQAFSRRVTHFGNKRTRLVMRRALSAWQELLVGKRIMVAVLQAQQHYAREHALRLTLELNARDHINLIMLEHESRANENYSSNEQRDKDLHTRLIMQAKLVHRYRDYYRLGTSYMAANASEALEEEAINAGIAPEHLRLAETGSPEQKHDIHEWKYRVHPEVLTDFHRGYLVKATERHLDQREWAPPSKPLDPDDTFDSSPMLEWLRATIPDLLTGAVAVGAREMSLYGDAEDIARISAYGWDRRDGASPCNGPSPRISEHSVGAISRRAPAKQQEPHCSTSDSLHRPIDASSTQPASRINFQAGQNRDLALTTEHSAESAVSDSGLLLSDSAPQLSTTNKPPPSRPLAASTSAANTPTSATQFEMHIRQARSSRPSTAKNLNRSGSDPGFQHGGNGLQRPGSSSTYRSKDSFWGTSTRPSSSRPRAIRPSTPDSANSSILARARNLPIYPDQAAGTHPPASPSLASPNSAAPQALVPSHIMPMPIATGLYPVNTAAAAALSVKMWPQSSSHQAYSNPHTADAEAIPRPTTAPPKDRPAVRSGMSKVLLSRPGSGALSKPSYSVPLKRRPQSAAGEAAELHISGRASPPLRAGSPLSPNKSPSRQAKECKDTATEEIMDLHMPPLSPNLLKLLNGPNSVRDDPLSSNSSGISKSAGTQSVLNSYYSAPADPPQKDSGNDLLSPAESLNDQIRPALKLHVHTQNTQSTFPRKNPSPLLGYQPPVHHVTNPLL